MSEDTAIEPHKILVVDDEPDLQVLVRQKFRRSIRDGQFEFFFAGNGIEALEQLHGNPDISVVLTDINMPGMDGLTLLSELKSLNQSAVHHAKAVVISAYGDMDNIRTAMNRGAFDFLMKPIDFGDVEITLAKTLEFVAQHRESRRAHEYRIGKEIAEENFFQLQNLEAMRDSLVHMIVHDLRTPLTAILGGLRMMPDMGELNPLQQEVLAISTDGSETLLGMINDLLCISKMESGAMEISAARIEVEHMAQRALTQVQSLAKHSEIELIPECQGDLPLLRADENLITRVLVNLLGNSIKFTPAGGKIHLRVRHNADEGEMLFAVEDTGPGIPHEEFERIFAKFGQVNGGTGTRTSTGLGLTFCKMAVEAHGGRIWIESEVGQGSTFLFALPCE